MATSFKREPKMKTTEPSADEVGKGMKKGGHAHKKHMAMGGALPMASSSPVPMGRRPMPSARPDPRAAMLQAAMAQRAGAGAAPMMRKKGGEVESKAMEAKEEREIKGIKKELKHHEHEKASKAHHGLKRGGMARDNKPGGLLGGISATRPDSKRMTGSVEGPGYKRGGKVAEYAETKLTQAKQVKGFNTKSGGVEKKMAYAKGGSVKPYEETEMHGGPKMPTKHAGTKGIKEEPAGYKHGGHVAHHKARHHHAEGGHIHMHEHAHEIEGHHKIDHHPMKKGGHVTHKKRGGVCNY
jgi:hypothetical protein